MSNVELSQLRVFLAAPEEKNFSAAAKRLHLSQSAISQNIQALEKAYGVELFICRGRSVKLSEEDQSILPTAREVINAARLLEDSLQNVHTKSAAISSLDVPLRQANTRCRHCFLLSSVTTRPSGRM